MNEYCETHKQTHVIPILVTLTDEEWYDAQSFFPFGILYFECTRQIMEDESMMDEDSNFGDFIRWLFKLAPTDKNIPVDIIVRRVRE
mgnify:FL=1